VPASSRLAACALAASRSACHHRVRLPRGRRHVLRTRLIACSGGPTDAPHRIGRSPGVIDRCRVSTSDISGNIRRIRHLARPTVAAGDRRATRRLPRAAMVHRRPRRGQGARASLLDAGHPCSSNRFSTDPRCRCSASSTARPWCRCCQRRTSNGSVTGTPGPTQEEWVPTHRCDGYPKRWYRRLSTMS